MSKIYKHRIITVSAKDMTKTLDHLSIEGTKVITVIPSLKDTHQIVVQDVLRERNSTPDPNEKKHKDFALLFHQKLKENKLILGKTDPTSRSWINHIRLLEQEDGIEWEQIRLGATYFFNNIGDEYLPVIQSTSSFRKKFQQVYAHKMKNKKK